MQMPILQTEMLYMTSLPRLGDREVSCGEGVTWAACHTQGLPIPFDLELILNQRCLHILGNLLHCDP